MKNYEKITNHFELLEVSVKKSIFPKKKKINFDELLLSVESMDKIEIVGGNRTLLNFWTILELSVKIT